MSPDTTRDRYAALAQLLALAGVEVSVAQAHGVICGALCAGVRCDAVQRWLPLVGLDAGETGEFIDRARAALLALCELSAQRLNGEAFAFEPLLPADAAAIDVRSAAIAQWCRGFMLGLLELGDHEVENLPGDAAEIVRDMMDISQLEAGSAGASGDGDGEADERAIEELREYLRVGVQLIFEELYTARRDGDSTAH